MHRSTARSRPEPGRDDEPLADRLQVRAKRRRRLWRPRVRMAMPTRPNERRPTGFMSDQLASGQRLRILNVVDDFSRMCVGQLVATSITGGPAGALP